MSFTKVINVILLSEQLWMLDFLNETVSFWISVPCTLIRACTLIPDTRVRGSLNIWPRSPTLYISQSRIVNLPKCLLMGIKKEALTSITQVPCSSLISIQCQSIVARNLLFTTQTWINSERAMISPIKNGTRLLAAWCPRKENLHFYRHHTANRWCFRKGL